MKKSILTAVAFACLALSSCITSTKVKFYTDEEGAKVYVDGKYIGVTPVEVKMSNAIWEDPTVLIRKEGYEDITGYVKEEFKILNTIVGSTIWYPSLLWCYGPKPEQYFILTPVKNYYIPENDDNIQRYAIIYN